MPALDIAFWRALLAGALFVVHSALRGGLRARDRRDAFRLAAFGVLAVGLFYLALAVAIEQGGVSLAWILLYTAPAWVAIGAASVLGERVDAFRWILVAVTVAGVSLVAMGGGRGVTVSLEALAWGLTAGITYALWYLAGKRLLATYSPVTISAWTLVAGGVVLLPFLSFTAYPLEAWFLLGGLGVVATYLPALAYYTGLATVDASRAAIVATIEPVVALGIGVAIQGERLSPLAVVGAVAVLAAAAVSSARR